MNFVQRASTAGQQAVETATATAAEWADSARDALAEGRAAVASSTVQVGRETKDFIERQAGDLAARVREVVPDRGGDGAETTAGLAGTGTEEFPEQEDAEDAAVGYPQNYDAEADGSLKLPERFNTLLLGAAGVAVAAAFGVALQPSFQNGSRESSFVPHCLEPSKHETPTASLQQRTPSLSGLCLWLAFGIMKSEWPIM
jgi:hypothetical protein